MLAACGPQGLMTWQQGWHSLACPLACADMLVWTDGRLAVLDNTSHAVWVNGRILPVDAGVEAMLLWRDSLLTLSGDTDCLTLFSLDTGLPLLTTPAGVYPQDMCLLPGGRSLAVCGGADGSLRVIRLPDLREEQSLQLPGSVQRAACLFGTIYALCTMECEGLCCQLCRIQGSRLCALGRWPGLPGAIHADGTGRLWVASSERLGYFLHGEYRAIPGEFGLIRHMDSRGGTLLASDPVTENLWQVSGGKAVPLLEGSVQHGLLAKWSSAPSASSW